MYITFSEGGSYLGSYNNIHKAKSDIYEHGGVILDRWLQVVESVPEDLQTNEVYMNEVKTIAHKRRYEGNILSIMDEFDCDRETAESMYEEMCSCCDPADSSW